MGCDLSCEDQTNKPNTKSQSGSRRGIADWQILATLNVETCLTYKHASNTFQITDWREPVKKRAICLRSAHGLVPGCCYNFRVRSVNCGGPSQFSAASSSVQLKAKEVSRFDGISRNGKSYLEEFSLRQELYQAATGGGLDVVFPSRVCKKMRQYKAECDVRISNVVSLTHVAPSFIIRTSLKNTPMLEKHKGTKMGTRYLKRLSITICKASV